MPSGRPGGGYLADDPRFAKSAIVRILDVVRPDPLGGGAAANEKGSAAPQTEVPGWLFVHSVTEGPFVSSRLLSIPAVAATLDVDRRTVYRFIAAGELDIVDLRTGQGRSRVRVPAASLDAFIANRMAAGPLPSR
ncbi:helix-turn-helix domain-containing protein [Streptomyces sp. NPDC004609]|uniref:helix-turn-helix domain-containing protein n=1 Tax=Streptomyces sp. NPDC004609 TaxID=3364704 RepID=UPI00367F4E36